MNTVEKRKHKQQHQELLRIRNRYIIEWSTKKLKTIRDFYVALGHNTQVLDCYYPCPAQLEQPLTREYIVNMFELERQALDRVEPESKIPTPHEYEGWTWPTQVTAVSNFVSLDLARQPDELQDFEKLPDSPNRNCQLFPFQERAAAAIINNIVKNDFQSQMLRAGVGTGKTFIIGAVADHLRNIKFTEGKTFSPWKMVYVTKASIVEQTKRVLAERFNLCTVTDIAVINIEQLRASFGDLMVRSESVVEYGEERIIWKWREHLHPLIIFWDECQILKNTDSMQSKIAQAFSDIQIPKTYQVFFSATPFMRVCEARCFAVATRIPVSVGPVHGLPLSNKLWKDFAAQVAHPAEPEEYCEAAVERLMTRFDRYIVDVKGVRPQFNAHNSVQLIQFRTAEEKKFYTDAWERYEKMKRKIEGYDLSSSQSRFLILAQFTIFRKAAELARSEYLADAMYECVQKGQAACLAVNFKGTIRRVVTILHEKYGVPRNLISLIWGGGKTKKTDKQKTKEAFTKNQQAMAILAEIGLSMETLHLDEIDDYIDDDPEDTKTADLRLGIQSASERTKEIDRFQSGKSLYCMFTFKAGGVGLSLHHTDEQTKVKVRRKKNNWAIVEDIPKVPTRQRVCFLAPTFSAIELVQGLGRCPRLTSLSDTPQVVVFYEGTIEERVAALVSQKLRCLRKVVRTRESWEDCIVTGHHDETMLVEPQTQTTTDDDEDDSTLFGDVGDEDE